MKRDPAASMLLNRLLNEKAAEEAKEVYRGTDAELAEYAAMLKRMAKGKSYIRGGESNFWAIGGNRKRNTIIKPAAIRALVAKGHATLSGVTLTLTGDK